MHTCEIASTFCDSKLQVITAAQNLSHYSIRLNSMAYTRSHWDRMTKKKLSLGWSHWFRCGNSFLRKKNQCSKNWNENIFLQFTKPVLIGCLHFPKVQREFARIFPWFLLPFHFSTQKNNKKCVDLRWKYPGDCRGWPTLVYVTKDQMLQYGLLLVLSSKSVLMIRSVLSERQCKSKRVKEMRKASDWLKTCLNILVNWWLNKDRSNHSQLYPFKPAKKRKTGQAFEWEKNACIRFGCIFPSLYRFTSAYFVVFRQPFKRLHNDYHY